MPTTCGPGLRDRAVRMGCDHPALEGGPCSESIRALAPRLGVGMETLRIWCHRCGPAEPRRAHEVLLVRAGYAVVERRPRRPRSRPSHHGTDARALQEALVIADGSVGVEHAVSR